MRRKSHFFDDRAKTEVIAVFGDAQLVKNVDGRVELRGGSVEDQRAAGAWLRTFMPEVAAALPRLPDQSEK